jgi:4-amino-4-deoxy-L-arabinose transferase-like glycosyltransferase
VKWTLAAILAAAVVAPWLVAIERRLPGYTMRTLRSEVFERVKSPQEGHKGPPGYYLLTVWGTYFPWSLLLPGAIVHAWRNRRVPAIRFALAAVIGPWIGFEIVQTKLPHYILPVFPPLAFLTADMLVRAARRRGDVDLKSRAFARVVIVWSVVVALAGSAPWLALRAFELPKIAVFAMIAVSLVALAYAYEVYIHFSRRRPLDAAAIMGVGMLLFVTMLYGMYLPHAPFLRISPRVAQVLIDHDATRRGDAIMIDYK